MIKADVLVDNKTWKKYIGNPNIYLNKKLKKGNWIVLYYSNHCGYCTEFMDKEHGIWNKFKKKKNKNYKCLEIDSKHSREIDLNPGIMGVPTIHKYENGVLKSDGVFQGERSLENLIHFTKNELNCKQLKLIS